MDNKSIRIVAAVVDTSNLTMYKEDGESIVIPQGDPRVRRIVAEVTPQLVNQGWADVVIEQYEVKDNSYENFEKASSGLVKFFRVAKAKLTNLLTEVFAPVPDMSVGEIPKRVSDTPAQDHIASAGIHDVSEMDEVEAAIEAVDVKPASTPKFEQTMAAVNEIMAHAVPVSSKEFHENGITAQGKIKEDAGHTISKHGDSNEPDTIIAVVDNKIIPGMEKIKTQFGRAAKLGSTIGVEKFLARMASVIENRNHSVEDLLKFLERADLPIADDGSILIYKVLNKTDDGKYVDCHSGKVKQWVGAYVCMNESLVDKNRRNECSNGLHVARRGYVGSFGGSVCVLAKLYPEDVIAVPEYDANKMRVCGYHIIAELTHVQYSKVKGNKPITDTEDGKILLAAAIAGKHIHRTHEVRIGGQMGGNVTVKALNEIAKADTKVESVEAKPEVKPVLHTALENPEDEAKDAQVNPLEVTKVVEKAVLSRKEQAKALYDALATGGQPALDAIHAFKKASKTSWEKLGLPEIKGSVISIRETTKEAKPKAKAPKVFDKKVATKPELFPKAPIVKAPKAKPVDTTAAQVREAELSEGSHKERIIKLLAIGVDSKDVAESILSIKKKSKKSWESLGVSERDANQILSRTSK